MFQQKGNKTTIKNQIKISIMNSKNKKQLHDSKKYVLKTLSGLYLSNSQKLIGCELTEKLENAEVFSFDFDNPQIKLGIWNSYAKKYHNTTFEITTI